MADSADRQPLPTSVLLLFVFGSFLSFVAIPIFLFLGALIDIDGPTVLTPAFIGMAVVSGVAAVIGPVAGHSIGQKGGSVTSLWLVALLTNVPAVLAGVLVFMLFI